MQLSKILLPVDFSERSAGAAHYAKALACRFHSELTIAHVFELSDAIEIVPATTWVISSLYVVNTKSVNGLHWKLTSTCFAASDIT